MGQIKGKMHLSGPESGFAGFFAPYFLEFYCHVNIYKISTYLLSENHVVGTKLQFYACQSMLSSFFLCRFNLKSTSRHNLKLLICQVVINRHNAGPSLRCHFKLFLNYLNDSEVRIKCRYKQKHSSEKGLVDRLG